MTAWKRVDHEWRVRYQRRGRVERVRYYQRQAAAEAFAARVRRPWRDRPPVVLLVVEERPVGRWRRVEGGWSRRSTP